ncbi:response regulator transcription factor [Paenibacillus sedimenti]|uniref:Response regulator n=1 Tax=Paenibacillus sedimenti TaxID=2770274 RepID=A0A926KRI8_9BACL|nr:response regulator [Paenibacillus sedimenti]MBD0380894.1 response regulator [Paenibacillus sedimenti]
MFRLMIVDDEPIIVDGLFETFRGMGNPDLEIYRAYTPAQAVETISIYKIDLVFTDIRMPGMTGIELQQLIVEQWPRCKVIFLSGYNDFNYVQKAIRAGGYDYILKTEGEDKILEAFHKAVKDISFQLEEEQLLQKAKRTMQEAVPILQKEYLISLTDDAKPEQTESRIKRFHDLQIPLHADAPVLLLICRVDDWFELMNYSDKSLLLYAIHNIVEEYLQDTILISLSVQSNQLLFMLQPKLKLQAEARFLHIVEETLDSIQGTCKSLIKLPISMFLSARLVPWEGLGKQIAKLTHLLRRGIGQNKEIILMEQDNLSEHYVGQNQIDEIGYVLFRKQISQLEVCLESGQQEDFEKTFLEMVNEIKLLGPFIQRQYYFTVAMMLINYMNNLNITAEIGRDIDIHSMLSMDEHKTWVSSCRYLLEVSGLVFQFKSKEVIDKSYELIEHLKQFIQKHLNEELSLTRLAGMVHLNPSYLSRFFKQMTGTVLTDYITGLRIAKAKSLLRETDLKIQDIAPQVGFDSPAYFIRLFKKEMHVTPSEYRDKNS